MSAGTVRRRLRRIAKRARARAPRARPLLRWRRGKRRLRRWVTRRTLVVAGLLAGAPIAVGAVVIGWRSGRLDAAITEPTPGTRLPALPVLTSRFDGITLDEYLRPPDVRASDMDELLASSVLRDPDFARDVHWWVGYWTVSASRWFPGYLTRMAERGEAVDSALGQHGFPRSLRYLPLIESGYDPRVTSRRGAVGMWQLMPGTARGLGLEVNALSDERRHPEKSTEAALEYLDALHGEFGSWFLTLAAYNTGPTRVRAILRRQAPAEPGSDSLFWALREHFPRETREFMPKLYGAMWVASRPEAYGY